MPAQESTANPRLATSAEIVRQQSPERIADEAAQLVRRDCIANLRFGALGLRLTLCPFSGFVDKSLASENPRTHG